jgi:hypothetical protein
MNHYFLALFTRKELHHIKHSLATMILKSWRPAASIGFDENDDSKNLVHPSHSGDCL